MRDKKREWEEGIEEKKEKTLELTKLGGDFCFFSCFFFLWW